VVAGDFEVAMVQNPPARQSPISLSCGPLIGVSSIDLTGQDFGSR
jgi:hypothetical protein